MAGELLNIVDENDQVIGQETRENIHRQGLLHREIHVLIFNKAGEILFQKRGPDKDTYPNLLDASVGGHVDLGDSYEAAAVRELAEETGLKVKMEDLIFLAKIQRGPSHDSATGKINNRFIAVYAYQYDGSPEDLEIESGKATSLEFWPIKKLYNLPEEAKKNFISVFFSPEYLEFYKKIEDLIIKANREPRPANSNIL